MKHDKKKKKKRPSSGDGETSAVKTKELDEEKRHIESLMEAFCSVSREEATSAYKEAAGDLNKAAELLMDLVENGDDPSTSSGQETGSTSEYGAGSWRERVCLWEDEASRVELLPLRGWSKEPSGKKAGDREKAEQFLASMLGDDCELSMAVVRDVLCQCGYDVDKALNVLLDMSSSSSTNDGSLSGRCSGIGFSDSLADTSFDTDTSESEPSFWGGYRQRDYSKALMSSADPFATSRGSSEPCHPQKVLESLFNIPQSTKHEPKTMSWRNVAKKMQSLGIDASSSSGEGSSTKVKDDGYHELRKGANDQWNVTKSYYQKAAEAYSKGGRAHAAYLSEKGRAASKLAQRADERASQDIFVARLAVFRHYRFPQTGVLGIRHSTFESLRIGRSSQSIASNLLVMGFLNFKKDNSLIHGFILAGHTNHYMPSLKAGFIVKDDRFAVARQIQFVQGSDLSKETTRVVIRLLIDLIRKEELGSSSQTSQNISPLLPPSDLGFISLTKFGILWYFGDISKQEKKGFKCKVYLVLDWKESLEMMFGGGGRSSLGGGGFTKRFTFSRRCHVALDFSNPCMCV
ncbi:hypothetical protein DY000_02049895 [Brassica cretica]|uniref:DUF1771 domain-containing protein n=1 Tax=Brassica cretica TaxID=69181 RepID=A0ABQ7F4M7_BRACR|nr:hypothetical protein DY000_02049895 [Brassica cretica]